MIKKYVGYEDNGFTYKIYALEDGCQLNLNQEYPVFDESKKENWIIRKWKKENILIKELVRRNIYFNRLLTKNEQTTIYKQLERKDLVWSMYYKGKGFPKLDRNNIETLDVFDIYAVDVQSKIIHQMSSW